MGTKSHENAESPGRPLSFIALSMKTTGIRKYQAICYPYSFNI